MGRISATEYAHAVIGVDIGTLCGFGVCAVNDSNVVVLDSGVWDLSCGRGEGAGVPFVRLERDFNELYGGIASSCGTVCLCYEEIRFHPPKGGVDVPHKYGAIRSCLWMLCEKHGIPYSGMHLSEVRKLSVGNGRAKKETIRAELEKRFMQSFAHGDKRVRDKETKLIRTDKAYDESDAVAVAVAFAASMNWIR